MKKRKLGIRLLALMLTLMMALPMNFLEVMAATKGDLYNNSDPTEDTKLSSALNQNDTISLPIKIYDYDADGMLFEYAESKEPKSATAFGATYAYDLTGVSSVTGTNVASGALYNHWSNVTFDIKKETYANYTRMTYKGTTDATWTNGQAGILLTDFLGATPSLDDIRYVVMVYRTNVSGHNGILRLSINHNNESANASGHQATFRVKQEGDTGDGSTDYWTYAVLDLKEGDQQYKSEFEKTCPAQRVITDWSTTTGIYAGLPLTSSGQYMDIAHVAYFKDAASAKKFGEYALTDGSDRGDNRAFGLL